LFYGQERALSSWEYVADSPWSVVLRVVDPSSYNLQSSLAALEHLAQTPSTTVNRILDLTPTSDPFQPWFSDHNRSETSKAETGVHLVYGTPIRQAFQAGTSSDGKYYTKQTEAYGTVLEFRTGVNLVSSGPSGVSTGTAQNQWQASKIAGERLRQLEGLRRASIFSNLRKRLASR